MPFFLPYYRALRGGIRLVRALIHVITGALLLGYRFRQLDALARRLLIQRWSRRFLELLGVTLSEAGDGPGAAGGLIVANHVSFLDILLINSLAPSAFVSKDGVARWPVIGPLATRAGTIYLERGNRRAAHRVQERVTEVLAGGGRVAIFPEGTTTDGQAMLPFHGALFQSAIDAGAPVRCLLVRYTESDGSGSVRPAYIGELSLLQVLWQIVCGPPLQARAEWLAPYLPPHSDRRHLAHHAHQRIAHALDRARRTQPVK